MIGQKSLIAHCKNLIENDALQHFCIFIGNSGSGRKTLMKQLASEMQVLSTITDISVASIREMIENAYKNVNPVIYIIPDADNMSMQAKNALLKVTEEPPNKAYFFMSLEDVNNTLPTIKSRATIYRMENYSKEELAEYFNCNYTAEDNYIDLILLLCETPGEIITIQNMVEKNSADKFYAYVEKVVDNIATVSGSNAFKIADKIALKDDTTKYDLKLFFKAFMTVCIERMAEQPMEYSKGVSITSKYLQELGIKGVNKQMLFDAWLLDIRKAWMEE